MNRRVAGCWVVVLTLVGMLAGSALIAPAIIGGARRGPVPAPPAPGSCMAGASSGPGYVAVDCAQQHSAEVVLAWSAGLGRPPGKDAYSSCAEAAAGYVGDESANVQAAGISLGWRPPPLTYGIVLAHGPDTDLVPGYSWQLCLVRPTLGYLAVGAYPGSVRGMNTTQDRPLMLRTCFARPDELSGGTRCDRPHVGEVLAAQELRVPARLDRASVASLTTECAAIASRRTGAADPTFGGRTVVMIDLYEYGMGWETDAGPAADPAAAPATGDPAATGSATPKIAASERLSYVLYHITCALRVHRTGVLTASIIGLGAHPLPLNPAG